MFIINVSKRKKTTHNLKSCQGTPSQSREKSTKLRVRKEACSSNRNLRRRDGKSHPGTFGCGENEKNKRPNERNRDKRRGRRRCKLAALT